MKENIVILGGGFGGVEAARVLAKSCGEKANITLISKKPYFEYYPGLYRVLSSEPPFEVFVPLRKLVSKKVELLIEEVTEVNVKEKRVVLANGNSKSYTTLILALGSEAFYFGIPGIEEFSYGCKSLIDARYLRRDLLARIKEIHDDDRKSLHLVIAGGGPTGVEVAGSLASFLKYESDLYKADPSRLSIAVVQALPHLVPQLPEKVSHVIEKQLYRIKVNLLLDTKIVEQKEHAVILSNGILETDRVIWTAGSQLSKVIQNIDGLSFSPRRKIVVDGNLSAEGFPDVYAVGDIAETKYSGLAQTAEYDGGFVGRVIASKILGDGKRVYKKGEPAYVMPVGKYWGVFYFKGFMMTGLIPHIMRYCVDIFYFFKHLSFFDFVTLYSKGRLK